MNLPRLKSFSNGNNLLFIINFIFK